MRSSFTYPRFRQELFFALTIKSFWKCSHEIASMPQHKRNECNHQDKTAKNVLQVESHYDHEERRMLKFE